MKRDPREPLHNLARGGLGMIPVMGPMLAEMMNTLVVDPANKRRDEFMESLLHRIVELEKRGEIRRENLTKENDASPLILQAAQIASRSRGKAKIEAIKAAAINGLRKPPSQRTLAEIVLNVVDRMTPDHLDMLRIVCSQSHAPAYQTSDLKFRNIEGQKGTGGLAEPVTAPGTARSAGIFVEKAQFELQTSINAALVADLVALGLINREVVKPDRKVGRPFGSDLVRSTQLGHLVCCHLWSNAHPEG